MGGQVLTAKREDAGSQRGYGQCSGDTGEEAWRAQSLQCLKQDLSLGMSLDSGDHKSCEINAEFHVYVASYSDH